jgi:hypothetical protein
LFINSKGETDMSKEFADIAVGDKFYCNGNNWVKKSTRTAIMIEHTNAGTYYFNQNTKVSLPTI